MIKKGFSLFYVFKNYRKVNFKFDLKLLGVCQNIKISKKDLL